jgi:hypothetical protein
MTIAAAIGMAAVLLAPMANAQPIADFYRGKSLRMLIGYGPGGGYDIYGRLVAEFLPRHIPGNPMIVPQNMPGGGSFVAAKFMAEAAPKDGTVFGSLAQTLALDSMTNTATKIDVTKFNYLGRVVTNIDTGVTRPRPASGRHRVRRAICRHPRAAARPRCCPSALNAYAGAKFSWCAAIRARSISCWRWGAARSTSWALLWLARHHGGEPAGVGHTQGKRPSIRPHSSAIG